VATLEQSDFEKCFTGEKKKNPKNMGKLGSCVKYFVVVRFTNNGYPRKVYTICGGSIIGVGLAKWWFIKKLSVEKLMERNNKTLSLQKYCI